MDIRVLKYFLAVARYQTILKAAESLHITQPTLSRQLMNLEEELNCKLFLRSNKKITLTESGKFLAKRAEEIISLTEHTASALKVPQNLVSGSIYIGCAETNTMKHVARLTKNLYTQYPQIQFHLFSGNAEDVETRIDKGLLDFGILVGTSNKNNYNFLALPAANRWGLLMRKDHFLAEKEYITASDLTGVPLFCSRQAMTDNELAGWLKGDISSLSIIGTYNLIYNASLMVEEGIGCALCLEGLVYTGSDSPLCCRPLSPALEVPLYLIWKKYRPLTKPAQLFLEQMQHMPASS